MTTLESLALSPETVIGLCSLAAAVSLACAASLAVTWTCRRRPAPLRHGILVAALTLVLLSPAAVWLGKHTGMALVQVTLPVRKPPSHAPVSVGTRWFPSPAVWAGRAPVSETTPVMPAVSPSSHPFESAPSRPSHTPPATGSGAGPLPAPPVATVSSGVSAAAGGDAPRRNSARRSVPVWWQVVGSFAAYGWAIGVLVGAIRLAWGCVAVARIRRSFEAACDTRLTRLVQEAVDLLDLRRVPPVFYSRLIPAPLSIGLLRPAIALPKTTARYMDVDRLRALLLHEAAHVARRDHWVGIAQRIAVLLFWWNPLVGELSRRISQLRECICDDYVVRVQGSGERLAQVLLDVAARTAIRPCLPATIGVLESKSNGLFGRIARLMDKERNMATRISPISTWLVLTWALALLLGTTLIGGLEIVYAEGPDQAAPARADRRDEAAGADQRLLPATTKAFVSITDPRELADRWNRTQLGQLIKDPVMKPFADDLRGQFEDRLADLRQKLGMKLEDLKGVPGGELSVAIVRPAEDRMAVILLVDVTNHQAEAEALLKKVSENLRERGATRSQAVVLETPVDVFDLPRRAEDQSEGRRARQAVYFLHGDLLGASDDLDEIQGILGRLAGRRDATLADVPTFQAIMDRCRQDVPEETPQIRWFIEPFGLVKAIRTTVPERDRRRGKTMLDHLEAAGFTAIQGLGGFVGVAEDPYELIHRTVIYAPKPHEKSMQMLTLPNAPPSGPPSWVPRDIAAYTSFHVDLLGAFDHIGPIFDEIVGEGEEGVWSDVLESLEKDPNGPQINLRDELFKYLDDRVIMISDYKLPISTTSERLLFAIKTNNPEAVAEAMGKTLTDEEVRRREFEGHLIWETVPRETSEVQRVTIELPPMGFDTEQEVKEQAKEERAPLLPNMAVSVAHGYLLIASHYDFLTKILRPIDAREALGRTVDYLLAEDMIQRSGGSKVCIRRFSRTDAQYRPTYELIREGKMPESQTLFGRLLNTLFDVGKKGQIRKQKIDGSKLPDFEFVRRHLGPGAMFGTSEENGWFVKGFLLGKETQ